MTALNIVSIVVTVALFTAFTLVYRKYRKYVAAAEGAIALVNGAADAAEPPRDGVDDAPLPDIVYANSAEPSNRRQSSTGQVS